MSREKPQSTGADDLSFAEIMGRRERRLDGLPRNQKASGLARQNLRQPIFSASASWREKAGQNDGRRASIPEDYCYKGAGCQSKKFQRLKRGKLKIADTCDLHGDTAEQARRRLSRFLHRLAVNRNECALVVCGKGLHSPSREPVVKNAMAAFMQEHAMVLAYCPALQKDGGHGAFYVLIRQSQDLMK